MERESKHRFRKAWKYPLFLLGLAVLIMGELGAHLLSATANDQAAIAAVGLALLVLSVALG
ncbi:MAG: hypothetical protein OK474_10900 [Thaumarchaeota archaeon]|nr:hypothetical protein [Nitrososphaerota archaeon]